MHRRRFLQSGSALIAAGLTGPLSAAGSSELGDAALPAPFDAAVMRVPVLIPPSIDALEDVRRRNAEAMVDAIEHVMRTARPKPRGAAAGGG